MSRGKPKRPETNVSPPPTSFVGRERELAEIARSLAQGERLLMLHGSAGTGKTRLAMRAALAALPAFPGGAWFVELERAVTADDVSVAVARTLGAPLPASASGDVLADRVGRALAGRRRALVILDNFEQVVDAAPATVARWLAAAPLATFLVTSRDLLRIAGERTLDVPPLGLPAEGTSDLAALRGSEAGRLLLDRGGGRARACDARALAGIARKVDGIPLAIELAASRLRALGPGELLRRLGRPLEALGRGVRGASARQATMEGAIVWSWSLLTGPERAVLAQVSVFRGGFDIEAAEAVVRTGGGAVLDVLQALVEKSLLRAEGWHDSAARFSLYDVVRAFATERLAETPGPADVRLRHAAHYAEFGEGLAAAAEGPGFARALRSLSAERDNLAVALEQSLSEPGRESAHRAIRLAIASDPITTAGGPMESHLAHIAAAIDAALRAGADRVAIARARVARGRALQRCGRLDEACEQFEAAVSPEVETLGPAVAAAALRGLGGIRRTQARADEADDCFARALSAARAAGDVVQEGRVLLSEAVHERSRARPEAARERLEGVLRLCRKSGDLRYEALARAEVGSLHLVAGRFRKAERAYRQALSAFEALGDLREQTLVLANLAVLHQEDGAMGEAERGIERALEIVRGLGDRLVEGAMRGIRAGILHETGRLEEACADYEDAIAAMREIGDARLESTFLAGRGAVQAVFGHEADAAASFAAADEIQAHVGDPSLAAAVAVHAGHLDLRRGAVAEVQALLARAASVPPSDELRLAVRLLQRSLRAAATLVARDGAWFEAPGLPRVSLGTRKAIARVLARLVAEWERHPGSSLTVDELLAAGWPGEKVTPGAGANRVRVAMATLRKAGLARLLGSEGGGYALQREVTIVVL